MVPDQLRISKWKYLLKCAVFMCTVPVSYVQMLFPPTSSSIMKYLKNTDPTQPFPLKYKSAL